LIARKQLKEALEDEPSNPKAVSLAKSNYMEALQGQLNYHEGLRGQYATFLTSDSKNELSDEPLLSAEEIAQLNSNVRPANIIGRLMSPSDVEAARDAADKRTGYLNSGEGFFKTPARLKQHQEAVKKLASELSLPDGWAAVLDDEEALAEIAKIPGRLERQAAYKAYALNSRPRHLVIKHNDPRIAKHNMMFELTADDASLITTPDEINTVLNSFTKFNDVLDISELQNVMPNSLTASWNPEGVINVIVGTHIPLRKGDIGKSENYTGLNASTSADGDLYINIAKMRQFDSPEFRQTKEGFYWRDPKDSSDKLAGTIYHELGHQVQYAITDADEYASLKTKPLHSDEEGEVNTGYSQTSETEHFAESISKFVTTGEATDRIKNLLSDNGLAKSSPEKSDAEPTAAVNPDGSTNSKPITWKMYSNPIGRTVTYTSSNGYLITRKAFFGVKKGKSGGYRYDLSRVDGSKDGIGNTYFPTLSRAKDYVEKISETTPKISENEGPPSQKLVMPKPEEGRSNKTVEASTLFKEIKALKESIANGEELQNYLKSRGREEDPDMAKLLDRQYRELRGLEFVEAYRKQTGKDRVSAPYSVFDGTNKIFDSVKPSPDAESAPESAAREALEEAYKELRAANRVQPMEPKATANKKLNGDDYAVMDILRGTMRNGSVMDIENIQQEAENVNFSSGGSLSKTIASLKRKGILTTVPDNKNRLALTESGIEKVAIVQAGFDKERRDAEERAAARTAEAEANIAAKEAAKSPEQKAQEEEAAAEFRAKQAALDKQRLAEAEEKRLFYETNLTPSEDRAMKFVEDALIDSDISKISEGSTFEKKDFEESLVNQFELRGKLPAGETPSSLMEEIISSLKKKGFITTVRGDKDALALTKSGAEKLRERLGLPSNAEPTKPSPDAEASGPKKVIKKRNRIDLDDDVENVQVEPSEIAAAAKAIAASGHGMKLDGRKSARTIDTTGVPIKIGSSGKPGVAPSAQAIDIKNNVIAIGNQVLEAAYSASEAKLREKGILPEDMSIKEYAPIARLDEQRIIETSEKADFEGRQKLQELMTAEIDRVAKDITEEEFKQYLADRKIPEDRASTMTLDDRYESYYYSSESNPAYRYVGGPGTIWVKDKLNEDTNAGDVKFDTGAAFTYTFQNAIQYGWTNRQRIAALKLVSEGKLSDYKELDDLAYEIRRSNGKATYTRQNRFADKSKGIVRDAILDEMKKAGVEFDSVDMSEYVGKYEPRAKRRSGWAGLSKKTRAELEAAFEYIPKDILLAARAYLNEIKKAAPNTSTSGIIGIIESEARAHFNTSAWGGYLRGNTADDFLHEFWHFFQRVNPDIPVLENAFLYDRLKDSNGNLSNTESVDSSYQFTNGNFSSPYTTKQYPYQGLYFDAKNNYNEVTTVGMQDLFTSPGRYSAADSGMVTVGKGRNKVIYRNPHMDIATGIWYTNSSMTEKIPGQENQKNISVRGRAAYLGEDTEFKAFNIGLMLSVLDWENK
jgi:DNA-binding MarR family transcriptional regulator